MSRPVLLDANVLIALTDRSHASHQRAHNWFTQEAIDFATCPFTEAALLRFHVRTSGPAGARDAKAILGALQGHPRHKFWPGSISWAELSCDGLTGHNQITDLYLISLAQRNRGRLVTMDRALAAWHPKTCLLIP